MCPMCSGLMGSFQLTFYFTPIPSLYLIQIISCLFCAMSLLLHVVIKKPLYMRDKGQSSQIRSMCGWWVDVRGMEAWKSSAEVLFFLCKAVLSHTEVQEQG
uniref:Uncharacterized protein n=1 Tax=Sphaerodactylus townsendi TaxID=933632 RepID=A0ACB8G417_9SAUR